MHYSFLSTFFFFFFHLNIVILSFLTFLSFFSFFFLISLPCESYFYPGFHRDKHMSQSSLKIWVLSRFQISNQIGAIVLRTTYWQVDSVAQRLFSLTIHQVLQVDYQMWISCETGQCCHQSRIKSNLRSVLEYNIFLNVVIIRTLRKRP